MTYKLKFTDRYRKQFKKLDRANQQRINEYLIKISILGNPRELGKSLNGTLSNLWSYRIGNYRLLCQIKDKELVVYIHKVAHRSIVYKQ